LPQTERSGLIVTDIEVLGCVRRTLAAWRRNFEGAWGKAAGMLSERFCRMWQYYLASCEVGFRYHNLAVFQIQLAKEIGAVPFTRDYLYVQKQDTARTPEHPF
jgi:cyclopropane-fatty-acyl-phospholipid synthase